jgi:hypothetical protein
LLKEEGFGSLEVANLFAYRATNPDERKNVTDPIGPKNDKYLFEVIARTDVFVAAWGVHGSYKGRNQVVERMLSIKDTVKCLGITKDGHPKHPLFLPRHSQIITYK